MTNYEKLIGKKFCKLTVQSIYRNNSSGISRIFASCLCDCGNKRDLRVENLVSGKAKECVPCFRKTNSKRISELGKSGRKHGMSYSKLFYVWSTMKRRCDTITHISYKNYGARGISVCDEWKGHSGFENFYKWALENGYSEGLQIDRIDTNGNYEPENCRWVTTKENANNTRRNVLVEYHGNQYTLSQLADLAGIKYHTLYDRYKNGWSIEDCVNKNLRISGRWKNNGTT